MRTTLQIVLRAGVASTLFALASAWILVDRETPEATAATTGAPVTARPLAPACDAGVHHPIEISIEALDPVQRGAAVRLRLSAVSQLAFDHGVARVSHAGGASLLSQPAQALGTVAAQGRSSAEFVVRVPSEGEGALVQFLVEGEGADGRIRRGATFNLLPDGPQHPVRVVRDAAGRPIAEYAARRNER